ncbi:MAG: hemolysin family protein [Acidimicrobiales bacterium]
MSILLLGFAVFLLLANGFFVAVEFALVASRQTKLEPRAEHGSLPARLALRASHELSLQLAGAQLGITMASLALGAVAEPAVARLLESAIGAAVDIPDGVLHTLSFIIALTIVVFAHMVIGEMVPKNIAITDPERTMLLLAIPNHVYVTLFRPVIRMLNALANAGVRLFGVEPRDTLSTAHTREELAVMLAASRDEGLVEEVAHQLLTGALDFGTRPISAVMVPRERVVHIRRDETVANAEQVVVASGLSRLPVVGRDIDDMIGFLHAKDLLAVGPERRDRPIPFGRVWRMLVVAEHRALDDVLVAMRRARTHLAVVVDDADRTLGIASLEDVLEAIVGDIRDESDPGSPRPRAPRSLGTRARSSR